MRCLFEALENFAAGNGVSVETNIAILLSVPRPAGWLGTAAESEVQQQKQHVMSTYLKIETVDMTILERISEADVTMWMACALAKLRETMPQCSNLQLQSDFRHYGGEHYYDACWAGHALDKCAITHPSIESMHQELHQELHKNPKARALEARSKAQRLLKEAEELEAASVG